MSDVTQPPPRTPQLHSPAKAHKSGGFYYGVSNYDPITRECQELKNPLRSHQTHFLLPLLKNAT